MNTYKATIKAGATGATRTVQTEIRAMSAIDAKWLLQAIYGFHAVTAGPTQISLVANETANSPLTPDQQRIKNLQANKDRASTALKVERDKQKRTRAVDTLRTLQARPTNQ